MVEGKAKLFLNFESRNALEDCMILCRFYQQFIGWDGMKEIIKATTGMDLSQEDMETIAKRSTTTARRFNLREGLTRKDDTLPPRMFNDPIGPNKEFIVNRENLEIMLNEYYSLHGWDENGIPPEEK